VSMVAYCGAEPWSAAECAERSHCAWGVELRSAAMERSGMCGAEPLQCEKTVIALGEKIQCEKTKSLRWAQVLHRERHTKFGNLLETRRKKSFFWGTK
jgi:hypothetical protein